MGQGVTIARQATTKLSRCLPIFPEDSRGFPSVTIKPWQGSRPSRADSSAQQG